MDLLDKKFNKYTEKVKKLENISDDDKLYLYANFKQAIEGDINIPKPSFFQLKESAKWNVWNNLKGLTKEMAMQNYIKKVKELYKKSEK